MMALGTLMYIGVILFQNKGFNYNEIINVLNDIDFQMNPIMVPCMILYVHFLIIGSATNKTINRTFGIMAAFLHQISAVLLPFMFMISLILSPMFCIDFH